MSSGSTPAGNQGHVPGRAHQSLHITAIVSLDGFHKSILRVLGGTRLDELAVGAILEGRSVGDPNDALRIRINIPCREGLKGHKETVNT